VFVARRLREDADQVSVTNLDGGPEIVVRSRVFDGERWRGFDPITRVPEDESQAASKLWCLAVEEVMPATR
jgi:hypothetical protein